jgi:hypothetical protein
MFQPVSSNVSFPEVEDRTLQLWRDRDVFRRTWSEREGQPLFMLYEGPPTTNGTPGMHHVLARVFKDVIPRYKTMRGYRPFRKGGWDTHGLPVELEVEKELGFTTKREIEQYGIDRFNALCRESVQRYKGEWEELTERVGFWLDLDDPYVTFHNGYIQTGWWIIKQLWDRGLVYLGFRVTPHCPRCVTSLSSHEVSLGYKEDTPDPSIYVRFPLEAEQDEGLPDALDTLRKGFQQRWVWTEQDLQELLDDPEALDQARSAVGLFRLLSVLISVAAVAMVAGGGFLGGRTWGGKLGWAGGVLAFAALVTFVATGPVYGALSSDQLDGVRADVATEWDGAEELAFGKLLDTAEQATDDFVGGIRLRALLLLVLGVAGVVGGVYLTFRRIQGVLAARAAESAPTSDPTAEAAIAGEEPSSEGDAASEGVAEDTVEGENAASAETSDGSEPAEAEEPPQVPSDEAAPEAADDATPEASDEDEPEKPPST